LHFLFVLQQVHAGFSRRNATALSGAGKPLHLQIHKQLQAILQKLRISDKQAMPAIAFCTI